MWLALCAAAMAGGCAGGAWLERPITAEVPLEGPQTAYPTALRGSTSEIAAGLEGIPANADATAAVLPASTPSEAASVTATPAAPNPRLGRQQANMPVLAVVPQQYVTRPNSASAPTISEQAMPPVVATPSSLALQPGATLPGVTGKSPTAFVSAGHVGFTITDYPAAAATSGESGVGAANAEEAVTPEIKLVNGQAEEPATKTPLDVDKERHELIEALEGEIRRRRDASATDEELPRLEQQLRLAYLAAGRLDDAVAAVESLDPQQREAYKNLMFGLGIWLSPDEARRAPLRTAKVLTSLRDATTDLAASSKLELRNLVFCERVDYFGWYTEFPRKEFQPKQQVILYVEVQNFAAEHKGPAGYETELHGSYEILDSSGQIIASRQLPLDKEVCRNYRRDYFLAYRIYMPDGIGPGHYRLELTVEDLKARGKYQGRKLGEGMIEFTIR